MTEQDTWLKALKAARADLDRAIEEQNMAEDCHMAARERVEKSAKQRSEAEDAYRGLFMEFGEWLSKQ